MISSNKTIKDTDRELVYLLHSEATCSNGLLNLVKNIESKDAQRNQKRHTITQIFKNLPLWKSQNQSGGHVVFKHQLTGAVVGWQGHESDTLKQKQVAGILTNVTTHLDAIQRKVFQCPWTETPDFESSLERFKALQKKKN